jgi:1-acyl-sn-glycerol-3-phosphate acyltransferase
MKYLLFPFRLLFTLYAFLLFIAFLLLIFPLVIVASLLGKIRGGNIIYILCQLWADVELPMWGIFHTNYYDAPHDINRQYVFVFNHNSYMDIPILMKAVRRQHFRVLGKAGMAKIPIFGFLYRHAVVLVDRGSAAKRAKSVLQLKAIIRKGISVVIAPEGTFNMTGRPLKEFYDGAFRIAIETQTPIKPILFLDNYDRMSYKSIFSLSPGKSRAIYLDEVGVEGLTTKDVQWLKEKVYSMMERKLIDCRASWIGA